MLVPGVDTPHGSVGDLTQASGRLRLCRCDSYPGTAQRGRRIAHVPRVVTPSRTFLVIVAAGLLVLAGALHMNEPGNTGPALRAVFAHLLWTTTFSGGHALQRRNS